MSEPLHLQVRRTLWKYRLSLAFALLGVGLALSIAALKHEADARIAGLHQVNQITRNETLNRISDNNLLLKGQQAQLTQLKTEAAQQAQINRAQNQIIAALLGLRKNDPALFRGITIPFKVQSESGITISSISAKSPKSVRSKPTASHHPQKSVPAGSRRKTTGQKSLSPSVPQVATTSPSSQPPSNQPSPAPTITTPPVLLPPILIPSITL